MNPVELPIKDIHLPAAVGWWPPAMGWWALLVLIPLTLALLVWLYKRITRKTAIKAANKLLAAIRQDTQSDNQQKLCALSALIRRTAISCYPRAQAASLTGQAWLSFLDQPLLDKPFTEGIGQMLSDAPYRKVDMENLPIDELVNLCQDWLKAVSRIKK